MEYSLTPLGESLNEALKPLEAWGDLHRDAVAAQSEAALNTH